MGCVFFKLGRKFKSSLNETCDWLTRSPPATSNGIYIYTIYICRPSARGVECDIWLPSSQCHPVYILIGWPPQSAHIYRRQMLLKIYIFYFIGGRFIIILLKRSQVINSIPGYTWHDKKGRHLIKCWTKEKKKEFCRNDIIYIREYLLDSIRITEELSPIF